MVGTVYRKLPAVPIVDPNQRSYSLRIAGAATEAAPASPQRNAMTNLRFRVLREANEARLPQHRNAKGEPSHSAPDGSDWSPNDWMVAVVGEVGEAANIMKKVRRGDLSAEEAKPKLQKEFADVVIYMDLMAKRHGIDLGQAVVEKFNEVSVRVDSNVFLTEDGSDWIYRVPLV